MKKHGHGHTHIVILYNIHFSHWIIWIHGFCTCVLLLAMSIIIVKIPSNCCKMVKWLTIYIYPICMVNDETKHHHRAFIHISDIPFVDRIITKDMAIAQSIHNAQKSPIKTWFDYLCVSQWREWWWNTELLKSKDKNEISSINESIQTRTHTQKQILNYTWHEYVAFFFLFWKRIFCNALGFYLGKRKAKTNFVPFIFVCGWNGGK